MNDSARPYDLIVWGASGFTGRLVVEYLRDAYPVGGDLTWAVAARNREKLEAIIVELGFDQQRPEMLIADSNDDASLNRLVSQTKVIITTVGPYARYGSGLVRACVDNGTHYCDLAGEVQWMRKMIDQHKDAARESGARIVHCCGFDSIPSDIGVHFMQQQAMQRSGHPCSDITLLVRAMKGGASGGTIASMLTAMEQAKEDKEVRRTLADPYGLNPGNERTGPDRRDQTGVEYNELAQVWTAPFVMASVNTRVVRRSNALLGYSYGKEFTYHEAMTAGSGAGGWMKAASITAGLGGFVLASSFDLSRKHIVERLVPKPGEGPDRNERENGFFNLQLFGKMNDGKILRTRVTGDRDPGYGSTSKMLSESAVCLAQDDLTVHGGFWTPATALGDHLMKRLTENAGLTFSVD
jgi:short subunit dehydrogenase-like uncharacterized protein